ncbi:MAG: NUDIX hydrolase [Candidatus Hydrothermales bacterium]
MRKFIFTILTRLLKLFAPYLKTPFLTVDGILEVYDEYDNFVGIALIERKNPPLGYALPGGFVNYGEPPEEAILREVEEETGAKAHIVKLLGVYGDPKRDPRFHTVTCVYLLKTKDKLKASSDAKKVFVFKLSDIPYEKIVFDHSKIIRDYLKLKY